MISFKQFLKEGGNATSEYATKRANAQDIIDALAVISSTLKISPQILKNNLIGSGPLTLSGKRESSGDIDIVFSLKDFDAEDINQQMLSAINGEGEYNSGTRIGSYAIPVNGKKIQADLMFVKNPDWAKFSYYSSHGDKSKYAGAVRNIILISAIINTQEPGKDFVLTDADDKLIARASRSFKLDTGIERLFKKVKINDKTGKATKGLEKVTPSELDAFLKKLGKNIEFSHDPDIIDDPDLVAKFIFGPKVQAKDIMTAEDVILQVKKLKNSADILAKAKEDLIKNKMEIPTEL